MFVAVDTTTPVAEFEMAEARRAGAQFGALFLIQDRRSELAYDVGSQILARDISYDHQRIYFDGVATGQLPVGEQTILQQSIYAPELRTGLHDAMRLPDVIVGRSWLELARLREIAGYSRANVVRWYPARDLGGWKPSRRRDTVVIWGPEYAAEQVSMQAFALHELHAEVVVVSQAGRALSSRCRYLTPESPETPYVLANAICVVDASLGDPSWARAFAERGVAVAAAATSGAHEVADGVALYDPWNYKSIWAATLETMGRATSSAREPAPPLQTIVRALELSRPPRPEREPLVSVIIPTYNRREDLLRALETVRAQTYPNVEVIVVNDGGNPVADLATGQRVRVLDRDVNVGPMAAINAGLREAQGEFVQFLADDDELYPDHLTRLVGALERTGGSVAHSNVLIRYETRDKDGAFATTGYNASVFCFPIDRTEVYSSSPVAGQALLVRRSAFDRIGVFEESFVLADQEIQIRLAAVFEFVHVPHVTAEWLIRDTGEQQFSTKEKDVVGELRRMFERHPAPGRPYIEAQREGTLSKVGARPPGFVFTPVVARMPS